MARRVFFGFHYKNDVWRANQIRNSWVTRGKEAAGFIDSAEFEKIKEKGDNAVKNWIYEQLQGTSVIVVLIGFETYLRRWVRYEIIKSFDKGNGLLGIYIHKIKDKDGYTDSKGKNPFEYLMLVIDDYGKGKYYEWKNEKWISFELYPESTMSFDEKYWGKQYQFSKFYELYDWVNDNGYNNLGKWIEKAAK